MTVMEFVLVAHAIFVGLAVAEILRGFADLARAERTKISHRVLLLAAWVLLVLLQFWWSIWRVGDRAEWTFALPLQPFVSGQTIPWVLASQLVLVVLAVVESRHQRQFACTESLALRGHSVSLIRAHV